MADARSAWAWVGQWQIIMMLLAPLVKWREEAWLSRVHHTEGDCARKPNCHFLLHILDESIALESQSKGPWAWLDHFGRSPLQYTAQRITCSDLVINKLHQDQRPKMTDTATIM